MAQPHVYLIHLRRPRTDNPNEQRDDPYYEFGSFGCTGCHSSNLLNLRHAPALAGVRLAFMQGGSLGFRLVLLTPPITVKVWGDRCEARWTPASMPFKYRTAPVLAYNHGASDFPLLERFARETARSTVEARLSSRFRSRTRPLSERIAHELVRVYEQLRATAEPSAFTLTYDEALPYAPPRIDRSREESYGKHIDNLTNQSDIAKRCSPPVKKRVQSRQKGQGLARRCS